MLTFQIVFTSSICPSSVQIEGMQVDHIYCQWTCYQRVQWHNFDGNCYFDLRFKLLTPLLVTWQLATFRLRMSLVKRVAIGSPIRRRVVSVIAVCESDRAMMLGKSIVGNNK